MDQNFQLNKLSKLHDSYKIIFCKTDFILEEFNRIKKIDNEIILITGNSDYPILDFHTDNAPKNIKVWFAQNALSNNKIIIPIPLGMENKEFSVREGHGVGYYERVSLKEDLLNRKKDIIPNSEITYANFNVKTNFDYRNRIKKICEDSSHIFWENYNLSLETFFDRILEHETVVCPIGNGIDTHRLWEVIYSNRIPITIKVGDYNIYNLYKELPIVILENEKQLYDRDLIKEKILEIRRKDHNIQLLDINYWIDKIKNL